jgi:hypothetical protein
MNVQQLTTNELPGSHAAPTQPVELRGEMWGITVSFNPAGYLNRYSHLELFSENVRRQGIKLLAIELAFDDQPFLVREGVADKVVRLRSASVLWQKERLLNIALDALPLHCDKVAWLDADILFENDAWVSETSSLLNSYVVIQPFDVACWLTRGIQSIPVAGETDAIANTRRGAANLRRMSRPELGFGHSGFAWAARRSLLAKHGFYDRFILGSADIAMFWAISRSTDTWRVREWLNRHCSAELTRDYRNWAEGVFADVAESYSCTPGRVFHLWHGDNLNRQYASRQHILTEAGFDPGTDIALDTHRCWQWNSNKPELHGKVREYFAARREDG